MKKFTKIALIVAAIMAGITIVCAVGAFALGFTWDKLENMVEEDKFNLGGHSAGIGSDKNVNDDAGGKTENQKGKAYEEIQATCTQLEIEVGSGMLEVVYADVQTIQVEEESVTNYKCYVDENTLHIKGNTNTGLGVQDGSIRVIIPNNMSFEEVDLEIGAGQANVNGLITNEVSIEVGAGKVNIKELDAREISAETGAGEIVLEIVGKKEDYSYNLECGIGELKVGETSYSGLGSEQKIKNPDAKRFLDAECGVGKIQINFSE